MLRSLFVFVLALGCFVAAEASSLAQDTMTCQRIDEFNQYVSGGAYLEAYDSVLDVLAWSDEGGFDSENVLASFLDGWLADAGNAEAEFIVNLLAECPVAFEEWFGLPQAMVGLGSMPRLRTNASEDWALMDAGVYGWSAGQFEVGLTPSNDPSEGTMSIMLTIDTVADWVPAAAYFYVAVEHGSDTEENYGPAHQGSWIEGYWDYSSRWIITGELERIGDEPLQIYDEIEDFNLGEVWTAERLTETGDHFRVVSTGNYFNDTVTASSYGGPALYDDVRSFGATAAVSVNAND